MAGRLTRLAGLWLALVLFPNVASGQWVSESYPLKEGWNAIWLSQDCSTLGNGDTRKIDDVLADYAEILEVWRWNPLGSSVQFTESPSNPIKPDANWAVWRRGDPANSTLGTLTGNSAYLVNVATDIGPFDLKLTGKPLPPNYQFSSSGLNFIGFPAQTPDSSALRNFDTFFSYSPILKSNPDVFDYRGGPLSSANPQNPYKLSTKRFTAVTRGKAYWVKSDKYSDYYGPIQVSVLGSGGIDFGRKRNAVTLRVKNVTDPLKGEVVTVSLKMAASAPAPVNTPPTIEPVSVSVRGGLGADLQFKPESLEDSDVTLAPGEQAEIILVVNRARMVDGTVYASILQITDDLNHTRIDLPVSAAITKTEGIWVGAAVIDSVNRVETILEPEFAAPLGAADNPGTETTSTVTTNDLTQNGQTTRSKLFNVTFDADDKAYLGGTGGAVTLSSDLAGLNSYASGSDFTVTSSDRATITNRGSGYTTAPTVTLVGGGGSGATATATLSAAVRTVIIDPENGGSGGSGYTSVPTVALTGGGGQGAKAIAIISSTGIVTEIRVTHGGYGYSTAPTVEITGGGGDEASAVATLSGGIGRVTIDDHGSGYTGAPVVGFIRGDNDSDEAVDASAIVQRHPTGVGSLVYERRKRDGVGPDLIELQESDKPSDVVWNTYPDVVISGGGGSGAEAELVVADGRITGVKLTNSGRDYTSAPVIAFVNGVPSPVQLDGPGEVLVFPYAIANLGGISGSDVITKTVDSTIGANVWVTLSTTSPAAAGTPDGQLLQSVVTTHRRLITLNGKSHYSVRRISSGADAAAPSNFPVRLILHASPSGVPTLMQQVYLGQRAAEGSVLPASYASASEAAIAAIVTSPGPTTPGKIGRVSSATFPRGEIWPAQSGEFGRDGKAKFKIELGHNAPTNPFIHTYHPDHDSWDARYESPEGPGVESYNVTRDITFNFSSALPAGVSDLDWGITTVGGTYSEIITNLRSEQIEISGRFILHQVSEVAELTPANP